MKLFGMVALIGSMALSAGAFEIGDDGLHKTPWQHDTFRDLREDLVSANDEGKTLLIMWEQRGCIYCTKMHESVFPDPEIEALLSEQYYVVQYNLFGDLEVTDFDGDVRSEKEMALKWGVMFTPNLMFFPEEVEEGITAPQAAVVNMPGAFGKWTMKNLLTWVREKGYDGDENFQKYHAQKIMEAREAGVDLSGE